MEEKVSIVEWYCMCRCSEEKMDHLLIHYGKTHQLCIFVFRLFGVY